MLLGLMAYVKSTWLLLQMLSPTDAFFWIRFPPFAQPPDNGLLLYEVHSLDRFRRRSRRSLIGKDTLQIPYVRGACY